MVKIFHITNIGKRFPITVMMLSHERGATNLNKPIKVNCPIAAGVGSLIRDNLIWRAQFMFIQIHTTVNYNKKIVNFLKLTCSWRQIL